MTARGAKLCDCPPRRELATATLEEPTLGCFHCIADSCVRAWNYVKDRSTRAWNWLTGSGSHQFKSRTRPTTIKSTNQIVRDQPIRYTAHSPPARIFKVNHADRLIRRRSKDIKDGLDMGLPNQSLSAPPSQLKSSEKPAAPVPLVPPLPQVSQVPQVPPVSQVNSTPDSNQPSVSTSKTTSSHQPNVSSDANADVKSTISLEPTPEHKPPKIDFIETGSIFNGRQRRANSNLLLLDNGRFRSPGSPNVITGPNGRPIRISFQTGFPSFKSIESRASLSPVLGTSSDEQPQQKHPPKKQQDHHHVATDDDSRNQDAPEVPEPRGGRSIGSGGSSGSGGFQPTPPRRARRRRRKSLTKKSVKSYRGSRENDQMSLEETSDSINDDADEQNLDSL